MAVPPPSPGLHDAEKRTLRRALRAERAAHVARLANDDGVAPALARAADHVLAHVPAGAIVAVYHAGRREIDPAPLAIALHQRGHPLALPHVSDDHTTMRFLAWSVGHALVSGAFGLNQPEASGTEVAPTVIVTPLLGFDRAGGRIGQGAGYYDRAFAALPGARRIGYAWSVQEVPQVPLDPWDVPLHAVATEREWIAIGGPDL